MSITPEDLYGEWALVSWYEERDGSRTYPYGEDAGGVLMYTTDDYMSVSVSEAERPLLPENPNDRELAAAYRSYFNYAGT